MSFAAVVVTAMVGRIGSGLELALLRQPRLVNGSEVLRRVCDDLGFAASAAEATSNDAVLKGVFLALRVGHGLIEYLDELLRARFELTFAALAAQAHEPVLMRSVCGWQLQRRARLQGQTVDVAGQHAAVIFDDRMHVDCGAVVGEHTRCVGGVEAHDACAPRLVG